MNRFVSLLPLALLPVLAPGCTSSLDLDRFSKAESAVEPGSVTFFDVKFTARSMLSHINEYVELRVVDVDDRVQAKIVYADAATQDFTIFMKRVVPKTHPPYRLDFWADHNFTNAYDGIEGGINDKDHAWRRVLSEPLPEDVTFTNARYELNFLHDTNFTDIFTNLGGQKISGADTLLPFTFQITGAEPYLDKMLELRIVDKTSGRLVGLHREGKVKETYTASITGILDEETVYEISAYVDIDNDQKYGPGDPSWMVDVTSTSTGIEGSLAVDSFPQSEIVTGE